LDSLFSASQQLGTLSPTSILILQGDWNEEMVYSNSTVWKFNHYAFLSQADVERKARLNKNPFLTFDSDVDRFFSRKKDTEVQFYVPKLKRRMLRSLENNPPAHQDDWQPGYDIGSEPCCKL